MVPAVLWAVAGVEPWKRASKVGITVVRSGVIWVSLDIELVELSIKLVLVKFPALSSGSFG